MATQMEGFAGWVSLTVIRGEEALAGGFDVQSGCEGFGPGTGEDDGSDGWGVREVVEDCLEFEPHSFFKSHVLLVLGLFYGVGV